MFVSFLYYIENCIFVLDLSDFANYVFSKYFYTIIFKYMTVLQSEQLLYFIITKAGLNTGFFLLVHCYTY